MSAMKHKLLIAIILLASFLRLWKLDVLPFDAHVDEVMNAYIGKFTLQNGVDLYGNPWPILYFDNFGDYPNILPMYLSGIGVLLFGNNEFGMRMPIALFGIAGVFLVYLISKLLFAKKSSALFAALTMAIFPWHIVLSRATAEGVTAATVFLLGLYLFLRHLQNHHWLTLVGTYLAWFLTYLLYPSYRIVVPLALLPTALMVKQKSKRLLLASIAVIALVITWLISQTTWGTGRFEQTSLFSKESQVYALQAEFIAGEGHQNALKARLFYNKVVMFGKEFVRQYASYFSFDYLFAKGGLPMRYFVPDQGMWYYSYYLLFVFILISAITRNKFFTKYASQLLANSWQKQCFCYLCYLLLLAPLSAALTIDDVPNVHRSAMMIPFLSILAGSAFYFLWQLPYRKIVVTGFLIILGLESVYFFNKYALHSNKFQQVYRSPAMKNMASYLALEKDHYDQIYVERKGETAIFYLFYNQIYNKALLEKFQTKLQIPKVDNINFTKHECVNPGLVTEDLSQKKTLFIVSASCLEDRPKISQSYPQLEEMTPIKSSHGDIIFRSYQLEATKSAKISP